MTRTAVYVLLRAGVALAVIFGAAEFYEFATSDLPIPATGR